MIERLLDRAVRLAMARPRLVASAALVTALAALYAISVPIDPSFAGVMDRDHPEVARYFEASDRYGLGGVLQLLIEGPEERLDEAVVEVRLALDDLDEVNSVGVPPPPEWLAARAPWVVERELFDEWVRLAASPPNFARSADLKAALERVAERMLPSPPEGARLVTVRMQHDGFELALDADDFPKIRRTVEGVLAPLGVTGRFAGMSAIVTQEQEATLARMRVLGPLSLVLVLAILLSVERRPLVLASIAVPMLLAVGCTLALIGLLEGRLTLMESVFGVIVFGLGIDFAIHLLLRFREEQAGGRDFEASLRGAVLGTGRGVVAGGVTTAGAFLILAAAPDPVFERLGLAGGIGLLLCLLFLLLMLPAQWAWIERRSPLPASPLRRPAHTWLADLADRSARKPAIVLGVAAGLLAWSGLELREIRYETNLERVFSRDIAAVETARRIHELFDVDPGPWFAAAADLSEARRLHDAFSADPVFARVDSLALALRADTEERRRILDALAPSLARTIRERERAARALDAADADRARAALEPLSALLAGHTLGPPEREALPESLAARWIGPEGELLVYAFVAEPALDSAVATRERRAAQAIAPGATSMSAIYEALIGTDRPWAPPIIVSVLLFIAVVVWLDLRSVRHAVLALTPVVASSLVTVGVLTAFGFSFNTVTLVAVPVLLGLGVDDGIHVVHRMLEEPAAPLRHVVGSVARSIALTTATTCGSVALLLFTRHPGIESVATLLLVGLPMALLATLTLIPAAAVAMRVAPGEAGRKGASQRSGR